MTEITLEFICPDLHSQSDAEMLRETLLDSPGVGAIDIDTVNKRVRVTTANQDQGADVRARLSHSGFPPLED